MTTRSSTRILAVAAVVAIAAGQARAGWLDDLTFEAKMQESCELAYVSQVVERVVDGVQVVMAKVHCQDKRVFDATRLDPMAPFRLKRCDPEAAPQPC